MIVVLDAGTSSTRALLFALDGRILFTSQAPLAAQHDGVRVEQDAAAIWSQCHQALIEAVAAAGGPEHVSAIGIANQRETVVAWDARTGEPLAPALVWQDRRTARACEKLRDEGHEERVQETTGLLLDPYFSATKMAWLVQNVPDVRAARDSGRLRLGTVDSWLLFKLTGDHATDASNASRTALMNLETRRWDEGLCDVVGVPPAALPRIVPMAGEMGKCRLFGSPIRVCGMAGDQQAATIGQGCLAVGSAKATFGTGLFALSSTGENRPRPRHRLLATLLTALDGEPATYALEGSVFVAGSLVQWLRDRLGLVEDAASTEALARSVSNTAGVTIVPAFAGLGAPYWRPDLEGSIHGLTFGATRAHLVRAALEAVTMSTVDLAEAFAADGAPWERLRVDGGMIANDWLAQDLADMLDRRVERPANVESTARGAAMLAAVGAGLHRDLGAAAVAMLPPVIAFDPELPVAARSERSRRWQRVMQAALKIPRLDGSLAH